MTHRAQFPPRIHNATANTYRVLAPLFNGWLLGRAVCKLASEIKSRQRTLHAIARLSPPLSLEAAAKLHAVQAREQDEYIKRFEM